MSNTPNIVARVKNANFRDKKWKPWYILLAITVTLALLFIGLFLAEDQFYVTQDRSNTIAFPETLSSASAVAESQQTVDVWADTSTNMYGFIQEARSGCVFSSYKALLDSLTVALDDAKLANKINWWQFSYGSTSATNVQALKGDAGQEQVYRAQSIPTNAKVGLLPVLSQLSPDRPAIIFTDLEGASGDAYLADISQALQAIFKQRRSVRIDRFISAFGGELTDYANTKSDIFYGQERKKADDPNQVTGLIKDNHHQPRAFFVLTIGTAAQCEQIGTLLTTTYVDLNRSHQLTSCAGFLNDSQHDVVKDFSGHAEFSFNITVPNNTARLELSEQYGVTTYGLGNDIVREAAGAENIQGYTVTKGLNSNSSTIITFQVEPQIPGLGSVFSMLMNNPLNIQIKRINQVHAASGDKTVSPQYLVARGNRRVKLLINPMADGYEGFSAGINSIGTQSILVDFMIDLEKTDKGLYRVSIPLVAQPDVNANQTSYESSSRNYSTNIDECNDAINQVNHGEKITTNVFAKTFGFYEFMKAVRDANLMAEEDRTLLIAQIVFDLRIQ